MGEMDRSNEIAAVFNLSVVNASQPACTLIKAVSAFKRIPRTGCVCSMDERSRPLWAYPYFVPKTGGSDNAQLSVGSTIKKTLNPKWDEAFVFNHVQQEGAKVIVDVSFH